MKMEKSVMNCLDSLKALYAPDARFGDCLITPMRIIFSVWGETKGEPTHGWLDVAMRISLFVGLACWAFVAAIPCAIGMALKMCSSVPFSSRKIKYHSLLDDVSTELYLPEPKRKKSPESAQLFSTFQADCINHILTFLSFRSKLKLLQITKYFKKVVEESTSWKLYFKDCENLNIREDELSIDYFKNNIHKGKVAFTPAYDTFYKTLAKKFNASLIRNLPFLVIETSTLMRNTLSTDYHFEGNLINRIHNLIRISFTDQFCVRVLFSSPDGGMGESIAFHDGEKIDTRHIFVNYWDLNTSTIINKCWVGENLEQVPFQEKFLLEQFKLYHARLDC